MGGKTIMLDCGMHMGFRDSRKYPDFASIAGSSTAPGSSPNFTKCIDAVIVTHFHLDHCGALPYFTEKCGYEGPVFMTFPTKAVCPILLEDFRRVMLHRDSTDASLLFSEQDVKECMKKVTGVHLHQTIQVEPDFEIRPYYAGHVLGAAMFWIRVGNESLVYTGDYNTTPDRHLGAASIDPLEPDLFISESTYATTIRDSKRVREREFLQQVHACVERGGKVLIPVFALGRAQELCILLETYWERMRLEVPIYFSAGLVERANDYYRHFISWTNEKIKATFVQHNAFDFKHIKTFDRALLDQPTPMVLFASPGMLHAGTSLEVFKRWCGHPGNLVIIPGYCVAGTVGNKVLSSTTGEVQIDRQTKVEVKCDVKQMSFSAHADARGILNVIQRCRPRHVMLVHGERAKMMYLQRKIRAEMGLPCDCPANGKTVEVRTQPLVPLLISSALLQSARNAWLRKHLADPLANLLSCSSAAVQRVHSPIQACSDWTQSQEVDEDGLSTLTSSHKRKLNEADVEDPALEVEASPTSDDLLSPPAPLADDADTGAKRPAKRLKYSIPPTVAGVRSRLEAVLLLQPEEQVCRNGPVPRCSPLTDGKVLTVVSKAEAMAILGVKEHTLQYRVERYYDPPNHPDAPADPATLLAAVLTALRAYLPFAPLEGPADPGGVGGQVLRCRTIEVAHRRAEGPRSTVVVTWQYPDDALCQRVLDIIDDVLQLM
eukprot:EG_transcript_3879